MDETKKVTLILRDGWAMHTPTAKVLWKCPTCGEPMGEPKGKNFYEDGDSYFCHTWTNPCGHVAPYDEVKMKAEDGYVTWKEILERKKSLKEVHNG
ncbi:hypothetical protein [Priestia megaterium]|uniref:hypothetical protein n=1 Tax=Priestia megaterium TaxID=1404 RepID=UPI000BFB3B28|nr:hypothetical protein [Priestia megaterium]PGO60653.1 hypothetical protein CN981_08880 [Priestia megaterium]